MHPILLSRARLGAYLLGWAPVAALFAAQAAVQKSPWPAALGMGLIAAYLGALLFLSSFFICRALPLGSSRTSSLVTTWVAAATVMSSLWTLAVFGILSQLGNLFESFERWGKLTFPDFLVLGTTGCILYLLTVALHYLLMTLEQRQEAERLEQELRVLAREAELKALRAQLNPHFLFNSLNSISALTTLDAKRAREMCVLLSDFLRKSLRLGERSEVSLGEEVDLLKNYLAIEQIRFGPRLQVQLEVEADTLGVPIPTLLLQPLVENAIKHGISQLPEGGIVRICTHHTGPWLHVVVENPIDPDLESPKGLGLGQTAVRQRLLGRYGEDSRFESSATEGLHRVSLTLPIPEMTS